MNKQVFIIFFLTIGFIAGCSTRGKHTYRNYNEPEVINYSNLSEHSSTPNTKKYVHPTMKPYVIKGIRYHPTAVSVGDIFKGNASWYGPDFDGKVTSSGEIYSMWAMTAAHKTLPMNTIVKVTNLRNGLTTVVRINDRGPFVATRIIDLSKAAAKKVNMVGHGTAPVKIEILGFQTKNKKNIPIKKELKKLPQKKESAYFALQIASFSKIDGALKTQEKYDNTSGYKTIIVDAQTNSGRKFKVLLIGFKSEEEARDYKVSGPFKNAFIVKED